MNRRSRTTPCLHWLRCGVVLCALAWFGCDASDGTQGARELPEAEPVEIDAPAIDIAANDPDIRAPMDATPSPDGTRVYYTALQRGDDGDTPGVFSTTAAGGEITTLAIGGLLEAPVSISISLDGRTLLVADSAASPSGEGGAILSLPEQGGDASVVAGTEGYVPSGLTVAKVANEERLYFTGREPESGRAGLFSTGVGGGPVQMLAEDAGFGEPGAVAVAADGTAYVVDVLNEAGSASLIRVRNDKAETLVEGIGVGFPAGVALTQDGKTVLVSGVDPTSRHDIVYVVDSGSGKFSILSKPFREFTEAAGLHRAHDANVFAWADGEANGSGTVYVLKL